MTPAQLKAAITPRSPPADAQLAVATRPGPSTPARSWRRWPTWCCARISACISDEIYEKLVYGDARATCFATLRPGLAERTITISGVSKSYAMTGWRMGWALGPLHVIKAMGNVQSQETSNPVQHQPVCRASPPWKASRSAWKKCAANSRPAATWSVAGWQAAGHQMPRSGRGVLRVLQRLGALRPNARRQESHRFRQLLRRRPGDGPRQPGAGLRVRLRRLCAPVVRHQPRANQRGGAGSAGEVLGIEAQWSHVETRSMNRSEIRCRSDRWPS